MSDINHSFNIFLTHRDIYTMSNLHVSVSIWTPNILATELISMGTGRVAFV